MLKLRIKHYLVALLVLLISITLEKGSHDMESLVQLHSITVITLPGCYDCSPTVNHNCSTHW
jgi:hypothetical protein